MIIMYFFNRYATSLIELINFRDRHKGNSCEEIAKEFTDLIANIKYRHNTVVETMAQVKFCFQINNLPE